MRIASSIKSENFNLFLFIKHDEGEDKEKKSLTNHEFYLTLTYLLVEINLLHNNRSSSSSLKIDA